VAAHVPPAQVYELPEEIQEKLSNGNGAIDELKGELVDVHVTPSTACTVRGDHREGRALDAA